MLSYLSLLPFFVTLILFGAIDFVWLTATNEIYKKYLAHLLTTKVNWIGIFLFYPLYALGLYVFVIKPLGQHSSLANLFLHGAFFGIVTYGTYDLTNYITLKEWPGFIVIMDMVWGACISGSVSVATVCILKWASPV